MSWTAIEAGEPSTLRSVNAEQKPPGRALLRLAGVFTQVACAACLLLGTIAFVLVQQTNSDGAGLAIGWGIAAMIGLVLGGLMARGGLIAVVGSALLDAFFGITLLVIDTETLAGLLRVLNPEDVAMIEDALVGAGVGMVVVGGLCLLAIPQAVRFGRWLHASNSLEFVAVAATARGWRPSSPRTTASMWSVPAAPPAERRSRRRMYIALGGFAIGFGAGVGVLVSSTSQARDASAPKTTEPSTTKPGSGSSGSSGSAGSASGSAGSGSSATSGDSGSILAPRPTTTVKQMLEDQREAIAKGDYVAVGATLAPGAIGFGTNADAVAIGRDAVLAQLARDIGKPASVEVAASQGGSERDHAWIAQTLQMGSRTYVVTMLAAAIAGKWQVVAWHWARPVKDRDAERAAMLGTKPTPRPIVTALDGPKDLADAVKTAFSSRTAFADARSDRPDSFNFGSGPGEWMKGKRIRDVFQASGFEIKAHDSTHVVGGGAWDPMQRDKPWIGVALLNVDYTERTRAATNLTHTFRVLAVVIKERDAWKLVLTQWSHGGPVR